MKKLLILFLVFTSFLGFAQDNVVIDISNPAYVANRLKNIYLFDTINLIHASDTFKIIPAYNSGVVSLFYTTADTTQFLGLVKFDSLLVGVISVDSIYAKKARIDTLDADTISALKIYVVTLVADTAHIDDLGVDTLTADSAYIEDIFATVLTADSSYIKIADIDTLENDTATVNKLYALILDCDSANIRILYVDTVIKDTTYALITYVLNLVVDTFYLTDTDKSNKLWLKWNEDDSGDRTLNLKVNSGDRTIDLSENLILLGGYDFYLQALGQNDSLILNENLTIANGCRVVIQSLGQADTLILNENFTIGNGYSGTLTYSGSGKTLTVEDDSQVNQDLTTDADVVHKTIEIDTAFADVYTNKSDMVLSESGSNITNNADTTKMNGDLSIAGVFNPSEWINVKAYGAKGDSTTNDATVLNALFDTLANDVVIYFPSGYYMLNSTVTIGNLRNLIIIGNNATIVNNNAATTMLFEIDSTTNVSMSGMRFDFGDKSNLSYGIYANIIYRHFDVDRCEFFNYGEWDTWGIFLRQVSNDLNLSGFEEATGANITRCKFYNIDTIVTFDYDNHNHKGIGIYLDLGSEYVRINNCMFNSMSGGIHSRGGANSIITNNTIKHMSHFYGSERATAGIYIMDYSSNNSKYTISNNKFNHNYGRSIYSNYDNTATRPLIITGNEFIANAYEPIVIEPGNTNQFNQISNNFFQRCYNFGGFANYPFTGNRSFIRLKNSSNNLINNNIFSESNGYCIITRGTSDKNYISNNIYETITTAFDSLIGSNDILYNNNDASSIVAVEINNSELQQLSNIHLSTIDSTQWTYVGLANQYLRTTDDVTFDVVTTDTTDANVFTVSGTDITTAGTLSNFVYENRENTFTIEQNFHRQLANIQNVIYYYNLSTHADAGLRNTWKLEDVTGGDLLTFITFDKTVNTAGNATTQWQWENWLNGVKSNWLRVNGDSLFFDSIATFSGKSFFGDNMRLAGDLFISGGNNFWLTDNSGADSLRIYDDGDTSRLETDNPFKILENSLIVSTDSVTTDKKININTSTAEVMRLGNATPGVNYYISFFGNAVGTILWDYDFPPNGRFEVGCWGMLINSIEIENRIHTDTIHEHTEGQGIYIDGVVLKDGYVDSCSYTLNSDKLDAQEGTYYLDRTNHTGADVISDVTGLQDTISKHTDTLQTLRADLSDLIDSISVHRDSIDAIYDSLANKYTVNKKIITSQEFIYQIDASDNITGEVITANEVNPTGVDVDFHISLSKVPSKIFGATVVIDSIKIYIKTNIDAAYVTNILLQTDDHDGTGTTRVTYATDIGNGNQVLNFINILASDYTMLHSEHYWLLIDVIDMVATTDIDFRGAFAYCHLE